MEIHSPITPINAVANVYSCFEANAWTLLDCQKQKGDMLIVSYCYFHADRCYKQHALLHVIVRITRHCRCHKRLQSGHRDCNKDQLRGFHDVTHIVMRACGMFREYKCFFFFINIITVIQSDEIMICYVLWLIDVMMFCDQVQ